MNYFSRSQIDEEGVSILEEYKKIEFTKAIKEIAKVFYKREHVKKESPIYTFNEMQSLFQETNLFLEDFFNQLYSAAQPLECNEQTMDRIKKLMVLICYLLVSLNNTKINAFKLDLAYYLDS
ncbi:35082_t:CDS:2, partial [Gigaspora margarita]